MVKRLIVLLVILLLSIGLSVGTSGLTKLYPPGPVNSGESLQVWKVSLTANSTGFASYQPTQDLYGKLFSVQVMHNNTLTGAYNLTITSEYPFSQSLLVYNLTAGNSTQLPRTSDLLYPLAGDLKFTLTNTSSTGANSADFFAILTLEV